MFRKSYAVATVSLMLVLMGAAIIGCPNNDNNGTKATFTLKAESLVPEAHFGRLLAITHNDSFSLFNPGQAVDADFQEFDFMNYPEPLMASLSNLDAVTEVYATVDDLSGLIVENDTLTFTVQGFTDDLFTIMSAQFQTLSTFAALDGVPLPTSGSQVYNLGMYSLDANNKVVVENSTTPYVRLTITKN